MHILTFLAALLDKERPASKSSQLESESCSLLFLGRYHQFFNFQVHHLAGPSFGIQGGSIVSKYFVNGCQFLRGIFYQVH